MSEHTPLTEAERESLKTLLIENRRRDHPISAYLFDPDDMADAIIAAGWRPLAARTSTATADTEYVWKRNDRADHDAGHPSGYDCDGDALSGSEACGHRYAATADTGLRERVEALADEWEKRLRVLDRDAACGDIEASWLAEGLRHHRRELLDATAAPTTDTGARDE